LLSALLLLGACGCSLIETEYTYSEPYADSLDRDPGDAIEVRNYNMLKAALLDMINGHVSAADSASATISARSAMISRRLSGAQEQQPLGAYAVDTLTTTPAASSRTTSRGADHV
jgi:hypothetical protein